MSDVKKVYSGMLNFSVLSMSFWFGTKIYLPQAWKIHIQARPISVVVFFFHLKLVVLLFIHFFSTSSTFYKTDQFTKMTNKVPFLILIHFLNIDSDGNDDSWFVFESEKIEFAPNPALHKISFQQNTI